jgi:hypothetical protein
MTTTVCITPSDEGAISLTESGALDPFQGLRQLLPKLTKPSWVRLIKSAKPRKAAPPSETPAVQRAIRRNERKLNRLGRALNGEFTRSRSAA